MSHDFEQDEILDGIFGKSSSGKPQNGPMRGGVTGRRGAPLDLVNEVYRARLAPGIDKVDIYLKSIEAAVAIEYLGTKAEPPKMSKLVPQARQRYARANYYDQGGVLHVHY